MDLVVLNFPQNQKSPPTQRITRLVSLGKRIFICANQPILLLEAEVDSCGKRDGALKFLDLICSRKLFVLTCVIYFRRGYCVF
jgi:hypothetical protein